VTSEARVFEPTEAIVEETVVAFDGHFRAELGAILKRCVRLSRKRELIVRCDALSLLLTPLTSQSALDNFVQQVAPSYIHITNLGRPSEPSSIRWVRLRFGFARRFVHAAVGLLCSALPAGEMKNRLYRAIGVSVGRNVEISQGAFIDTFAPRLITIGDDVVIGAFAKIFTHVYRGRGRMFFGPVMIGHDSMISGTATVGPCLIEPNVTLLPNVITIPFLRFVKSGAIVGFGHRPEDVRSSMGDFPP
jgi:acetyltransferase-like isoleucine patch superfamily enzyme